MSRMGIEFPRKRAWPGGRQRLMVRATNGSEMAPGAFGLSALGSEPNPPPPLPLPAVRLPPGAWSLPPVPGTAPGNIATSISSPAMASRIRRSSLKSSREAAAEAAAGGARCDGRAVGQASEADVPAGRDAPAIEPFLGCPLPLPWLSAPTLLASAPSQLCAAQPKWIPSAWFAASPAAAPFAAPPTPDKPSQLPVASTSSSKAAGLIIARSVTRWDASWRSACGAQ
eukprot:363955-Chlamydomonas_euryale.AAC.3